MSKKHLFLLMTSSLLLTLDTVSAAKGDKEEKERGRDDRRQERESRREGRRDDRQFRREDRREDRSDRLEQLQERRIDRREIKKPFDQSKDLQKDDWRSRVRDRRDDDGKRDFHRREDLRRDGSRDRDDWRKERFSRERLREKENKWRERSKDWRHRFPDYRRRDHIFDDHFWNRFNRRYNHWYFDNRFSWSVDTTWPNVVVWLPWRWSRPIYYYYESDGDVYYSETEDFSYLVPIDSKEQFIAEAVRLANTPRPLSRDQSNWKSLGMFALSYDNESSDMPKEFISLAISREGAVSGAYFNQVDNEMLEIQGAVDKDSQRVAWKFVGKDWPIMESGIYNLTKEDSTLLVHTGRNSTETRVIVRLK
jgi:hypothetical protein